MVFVSRIFSWFVSFSFLSPRVVKDLKKYVKQSDKVWLASDEDREGEWNGQGIFTISDGTKYVGEFKDGTDWNTTGYDKDGNIIGRYVNGTEQ